jgi:chaperone BCS1
VHVKVIIENEESRDDKGNINTKTDKISITIYSYKYSINYLIDYIDNITKEYLSSIKQNRINTKFIYFLEKTKVNDEENELACWGEYVFESARAFNNIFFDGKRDLISKIDFFINNKDWYYEKGIPYSLGIGLHGPPGTGKTSFIKALANYTNRHIIVLSLKLIKTKRQLERFFFENMYNNNNEKNSITFDKKIIVFEDIDCIGDIILDRNQPPPNPSRRKNSNKVFDTNADSIKISDVLQTINDTKDNTTIKINLNDDPPITLDDILNLWDGIRETPGRILVISSNYYSKLDSALIRPGRIDITHELCNASHNVIAEIYSHLFDNSINKNILSKIKPNFYSPAELINMYVSHKNEKDFLCRLLQNQK